jgi:hypothetical protein
MQLKQVNHALLQTYQIPLPFIFYLFLLFLNKQHELPSWTDNPCGYDTLLTLYYLVNDLVHLLKSDHHHPKGNKLMKVQVKFSIFFSYGTKI